MNVGLIFKAIPWRTLLEQLPFLTTTAQSAYDRISGRRTAALSAATEASAAHAGMTARVAQLEAQLRDAQADAAGQAEMVQKLAEEIAAQAGALEILGARQRFLFGIAGGSLVLSLALLLVVVLR